MTYDELFNELTKAFPKEKLGLLQDIFAFLKPRLRCRATNRIMHSYKGKDYSCIKCGAAWNTHAKNPPCSGKFPETSDGITDGKV